jgi:hypothetical protein
MTLLKRFIPALLEEFAQKVGRFLGQFAMRK